jgi:hypothetical protein
MPMFAEYHINYPLIIVLVAVGIPLVLAPVLLLTYWLTRKPRDEQ